MDLTSISDTERHTRTCKYNPPYVKLLFEMNSSIFGYSAASTKTAAYIIGGMFHVNSRERDEPYDMIAQFKDDQWSYYGKLHRGRMGHGSITVGDYTMILGGFSGESKDP